MAVEVIKGTEVTISLDDDVIGRAASVTLRLENNVEEFHEIGDRDAVEVKEGTRSASGTLQRATINGMLFAKVMNKYTGPVGSVYTITDDEYQNPIASVSGEAIAADSSETVFSISYQPPIRGTLIIKRDGTAWGTEDTNYTIDYADGIITFSSAPSSGNTWTVDYDWGRSYTLTFLGQVADGSNQYTSYTVGGVMFDNIEIPVNNAGDVVMESLDYKAKTVDTDGAWIGTPATGI